MAQKQKSVLERVREQAMAGELADNVTIVYRVSGGAPGQRYSESVVLTASGKARITVQDELEGEPGADVHDEIGHQVALEVCHLLAAGLQCLIPESEAQFVPDALVGSISVGIGDEAETYYFDADEEACEHMGRPMPNELRAIRERFNDIERTSLAKTQGARKD